MSRVKRSSGQIVDVSPGTTPPNGMPYDGLPSRSQSGIPSTPTHNPWATTAPSAPVQGGRYSVPIAIFFVALFVIGGLIVVYGRWQISERERQEKQDAPGRAARQQYLDKIGHEAWLRGVAVRAEQRRQKGLPPLNEVEPKSH